MIFYKDNDIILFNGNNVEIIPKLENNSIQCIITSPPYFNLQKYDKKLNYLKNEAKYIDFISSVFEEIYPKLKNEGSIILNLGPVKYKKERSLYPFKVAMKLQELGYKLWELLIWNKKKSLPLKGGFSQRHEYLFIFVKNLNDFYINIDEMRIPYAETTKERYKRTIQKRYVRENYDGKSRKKLELNPKGALPNSIIEIVSPTTLQVKNHFAVYPVELAEYFIKGFSRPGDIVMDPFMGSGTTGVACVKTGRKFIGIDISKEYCQIAKDRILDAKKKNNIK